MPIVSAIGNIAARAYGGIGASVGGLKGFWLNVLTINGAVGSGTTNRQIVYSVGSTNTVTAQATSGIPNYASIGTSGYTSISAALAFSPNGHVVIGGSAASGTPTVYLRTAGQTLLWTAGGGAVRAGTAVNSAIFSPSGTYLLYTTGSVSPYGTVFKYNGSSYVSLKNVTTLATSPNGNQSWTYDDSYILINPGSAAIGVGVIDARAEAYTYTNGTAAGNPLPNKPAAGTAWTCIAGTKVASNRSLHFAGASATTGDYKMWSYSAGTFTDLGTVLRGTATLNFRIQGAAWTQNNAYFGILYTATSGSAPILSIYSFISPTNTFTYIGDISMTGTTASQAASYDSLTTVGDNFIVTSMNTTTANTVVWQLSPQVASPYFYINNTFTVPKAASGITIGAGWPNSWSNVGY